MKEEQCFQDQRKEGKARKSIFAASLDAFHTMFDSNVQGNSEYMVTDDVAAF